MRSTPVTVSTRNRKKVMTPMHQGELSSMPLLPTETGCKCRKTVVSMTTTRLRRSRGAGLRKMLFQTCELRMKSPTDILVPLDFDERIGVGPLTEFFLELA